VLASAFFGLVWFVAFRGARVWFVLGGWLVGVCVVCCVCVGYGGLLFVVVVVV